MSSVCSTLEEGESLERVWAIRSAALQDDVAIERR